MNRRRVAFHTLGCKVNQADTAAVAEAFRLAGYRQVPFREEADVYVVNTCAVTADGERASRQAARQAARRNPGAQVAMVGCYAQLAPEALKGLPGISLVASNEEKAALVEMLAPAQDFKPVAAVGQLPGRTRAIVKVQDGCDELCAYCVVPFTRGRSRSRTISDVVTQVRSLAELGVREVVLVGVHLGDYAYGLRELLAAVSEVEGIQRIRLGSLEPFGIGQVLEALPGLPKVCPNLHLPLQSGSDRILTLMGRPYTAGDYRAIVAKARALVPGLSLTTDCLVGFPGETDADFQETCALVEELALSGLHIFSFSPRPGTRAAATRGQVPASVVQERRRTLEDIGRKLAADFAAAHIGQEVEVLVEHKRDQHWRGKTRDYFQVAFPARMELRNCLVRVLVTGEGMGELMANI